MSANHLFSPLDTRYAKDLPESLSEAGVLRFQVEVERQWLLCLMEHHLCPLIDENELNKIFAGLSMNEIEAIEQRTQHATRALVEALAERLKNTGHPKVADWVHVGLTSFDTVDTAQRLRLKEFFKSAALPAIDELMSELKRWTHLHKATPQVGRTHGQWAVPSFFGLIFAEAHERVEHAKQEIIIELENLRGQASGAIGGYQALGLITDEPLKFESAFLKKLGLKPHFGATQILPPEDVLALAQNFTVLASVVAKLATDLRHLARSEIGEIAEGLAPGQVGSSTMPQKRNPWNLEHVCSLYKVLLSRLHLLEMDLVSEHQRDLTNSASSRFYGEVFAIGFLMIKRLTKVLKGMEISSENMQKHLAAAGTSIFAEAFYVLATKNGVADAHHKIREAARESERSGKTLFEIVSGQGYLPKGMTLAALENAVFMGPQKKLEAIVRQWNLGVK